MGVYSKQIAIVFRFRHACRDCHACVQVTIDAGQQVARDMKPCDLVLDSNTAVVLDCGTHIFLWLGANIELPADLHSSIRHRSLAALEASTAGGTAAALLQAPQTPESSGILNACVQVAHACALGRVPVPELKVCLEGTGDERYVLSRLAPTDSMARGDLVLAQLPHLVELYEEDAVYAEAMVAHITRRLPKTDEPAFAAWAAQAGVDVRAALLGEDPDSHNPGRHNGAASEVGGAPRGSSASSRPGSAPVSRLGSARGGSSRKMTPANSTGDKADDVGIFSFLGRRRGDVGEGVNGQSSDVESGLGGVPTSGASDMHQVSMAAPPVATHPPPPGAHVPTGDRAVLHHSGGVNSYTGVRGAIAFQGISPQTTAVASAAANAATSSPQASMHDPHAYTPPQTDADGPNNIVHQPFRHNTLQTHGAHASPRSPMVPMPPRPC